MGNESMLGTRLSEQLKISEKYSQLRQHIQEYVSHANEFSLRTDVINTDETGFRISSKPNEGSSLTTSIIFTGGSVCFGWGASSDEMTTPSVVARTLGVKVKNLGICAGNSTSEFIAAALLNDAYTHAVSITGTNTLVNQYLNWDGNRQSFEPFMPFHQEYWRILRTRDLLMNRALIDANFHPFPYFKSTAQRRRFLKERLRFMKEKIVNLFTTKAIAYFEPTAANFKEIVSRAVSQQARSCNLLNQIFTNYTVIIQPFLLDGNRKPTDDEAQFVAYHRNRHRDGKLQKMFYEFMPSMYSRYSQELRDKLVQLGIRVMIYTPPNLEWSYSDLSHLNDFGYRDLANSIISFGID